MLGNLIRDLVLEGIYKTTKKMSEKVIERVSKDKPITVPIEIRTAERLDGASLKTSVYLVELPDPEYKLRKVNTKCGIYKFRIASMRASRRKEEPVLESITRNAIDFEEIKREIVNSLRIGLKESVEKAI